MSERNHTRKLSELLNQYTEEAIKKNLNPDSPELPKIALRYDLRWQKYCNKNRRFPMPNEKAFMNNIKLCQ